MSDWDIDPAGVQGVLTHTADLAAGFEQPVNDLSLSLEVTATAADSGPVSEALSAFATSIGTDIEAVFTQTSAALDGCVGAVQAYVDGDLEMAANAQANATAAPSGDFGSGPR